MPNSRLVHPVDHVMYTFSLDICTRNLLMDRPIGKLYLFYVSEINNIQFKKILFTQFFSVYRGLLCVLQ